MKFFDVLGILFIGLKLAGFIAWSWWWVTMPLYLPFILAIILAILVKKPKSRGVK